MYGVWSMSVFFCPWHAPRDDDKAKHGKARSLRLILSFRETVEEGWDGPTPYVERQQLRKDGGSDVSLNSQTRPNRVFYFLQYEKISYLVMHAESHRAFEISCIYPHNMHHPCCSLLSGYIIITSVVQRNPPPLVLR